MVVEAVVAAGRRGAMRGSERNFIISPPPYEVKDEIGSQSTPLVGLSLCKRKA